MGTGKKINARAKNLFCYLLFVFYFSSCSPELKTERIKKDFTEKYPTFEFVSAIVKDTDNFKQVTIDFKKSGSPRTWTDTWKYVSGSAGWTAAETKEVRIIQQLPRLINKSERDARENIQALNIEIDSVRYVDAPDCKGMLQRIVIDVIYKGRSIGGQSISIAEGEKVTLVLCNNK